MPNETRTEKEIRELFKFSVITKGLFAAFELGVGVLALFLPPAAFAPEITSLAQIELTEDPHDFIATHLLQFGHALSLSATAFGAIYLISHGVIKLFLVASLLRNKLWAYPASLGVLGLFIAYELYRFAFTESAGLLLLVIFDAIVIYFIWREYLIVKAHMEGGVPGA